MPLSAREFELLRYLFAHRNEVVSAPPCCATSRAYSHLSVTGTIDDYITKLRMHIEPPAHDPRFIITVHGRGYQLLV